jgi:hypothetical protein
LDLRFTAFSEVSSLSYGTDLHGALSAQPRDLLHDPAPSPEEVALVIRTRGSSWRLLDEAAQRPYDGTKLYPALWRQMRQSLLQRPREGSRLRRGNYPPSLAAQKVEYEDRSEAERDELLTLERWSRITAEDLDRARVVAHGLPIRTTWRRAGDRAEAFGFRPTKQGEQDQVSKVRNTAESYRDNDLDELIRDAVMEAVGDEVVERLLPKFRSVYDMTRASGWLADAFSVPSTHSWREVVYRKITDQGRQLTDDIEGEVRRILRIEDDS